MPAREPVIKFSPFEALLIGEKNNILKRQPMKNTIFVTKLNRQRKSVNLRDLFGLESDTKTDSNEAIFKMPQRVHEFLKHRKKVQKKRSNLIKNQKDEILCYEFEGCKMINKNNKTSLPNGKTLIVKLNKIKFKENNFKKVKYKSNVMHKVVKKFPSPSRRRNCHDSEYKFSGLNNNNNNNNNTNTNVNVKRHTLRGKDGKFKSKKDCKTLKSANVSPKQKYLSNYLHQLYLKKNKEFINAHFKNCKNYPDLPLPYSLETVVGLPNPSFDVAASEALLNKVSKKYYKNNCHEDFKFPELPKQLEPLDFESDSYLIDLIYEDFPKIVKFESKTQDEDFNSALLNADIIKPEKKVRMYEKKKNGFVKDKDVEEVLVKRFPIIKLRRINEIMPDLYPIRNGKNIFQSKIDEPYTRKSHLIQDRSFGRFFFQSAEGKDIFIGNLIKPFLENSWFGSLPES